jgi:dihydrofolate reductase
MSKLIYTAIASLDGYIEDAAGGFDWAAPDPEVHAFVNAIERPIGTYLYGRRLYETMVFWQKDPTPDSPDVVREYATIWQAAEKIVFSRTLPAVHDAKTRLEPEFTPALIVSVLGQSEHDVSIGGAGLAAQAFEAGLIDEVQLFLHPITVGGGRPALPGGVRLQLLQEQRFESGVVYLRYDVRPED